MKKRFKVISVVSGMLALLSTSGEAIAAAVETDTYRGIQSFKTENLRANVEIVTSEETNVVTVSIEGEGIESRKKGGELLLMNFSDDSETFMGSFYGNQLALPTIKLLLPDSVSMNLGGAAGKWDIIGDTKANFKASLSGRCTMKASRIEADTVEVSVFGDNSKFEAAAIKGAKFVPSANSKGSIEVDKVSLKEVNLGASINAHITINKGKIKNLAASTSLEAKVTLNCSVKKAELNASTFSAISVKKVKEQLKENAIGDSKITVDKRPKEMSRKVENNAVPQSKCVASASVVGCKSGGGVYVYSSGGSASVVGCKANGDITAVSSGGSASVVGCKSGGKIVARA